MNFSDAAFLDQSVRIAFLMLSASLVPAFVRLVRGPSLPDRVVALELFSTLVVGLIAVHAVLAGESDELRPAIALALVSFLGTVAFARYIEKRGAP